MSTWEQVAKCRRREGCKGGHGPEKIVESMRRSWKLVGKHFNGQARPIAGMIHLEPRGKSMTTYCV